MANKLAGQRAKFSRARATYYSSSDELQRRRALELMAEVLRDAPSFGFSKAEVTQEEDVPDQVQLHYQVEVKNSATIEENPDTLIAALGEAVDLSDVLSMGTGDQWVYAYGYACAPDRLKIGCSSGDPVSRIAAQIGTSTPDRPALHLKISTHDCRALERVLHGTFRLRGQQVEGAGAEWFRVTRDEIIAVYKNSVKN